MEREEILAELNTKLAGIKHIIHASTTDLKEQGARFKEVSGVLMILDAAAEADIKASFMRSFRTMFRDQPITQPVNVDEAADLLNAKHTLTGVCANHHSGFVNQMPQSGSPVVWNATIFQRNPFLAENIDIVAQIPNFVEVAHPLLKTEGKRMKLSSDTGKVKRGKNYTPVHVDLYSGGKNTVDRVQCILAVEGNVRLFYVPGTHRPDVVELLGQLGLVFSAKGFDAKKIPDDIMQVLNKHAVAAPTCAATFFAEGVIHFEGPCEEEAGRFLSFPDIRNATDLRVRLYIGVETLAESEEINKVVAAAAVAGLTPSCFRKGNIQVVNKKSTRFKDCNLKASVFEDDGEQLKWAVADPDDVLSELPPAKRRLLALE